MKPTEKIIFHWTDRLGKKQSLSTTFAYFKEYAIELLEHETLDIVKDVYYTVNSDGITHKLDYYNTYL